MLVPVTNPVLLRGSLATTTVVSNETAMNENRQTLLHRSTNLWSSEDLGHSAFEPENVSRWTRVKDIMLELTAWVIVLTVAIAMFTMSRGGS